MPENTPLASRTADLALLVDLEARWENLRPAPSVATDRRCTHQELTAKQRAYESFRLKLVAYNAKYHPGYLPAFLRGSPARLAAWLREMRELYRQVEETPHVPSPVHVLEKAYRCADAVAAKAGQGRFNRAPAPETVAAAVQELQALQSWCDELPNSPRP